MLRTPLCDLLEIDVPVIQAAIAPWTPPDLVAAVSNAGGLGSYATAMQSPDRVRDNLQRIKSMTPRPFVVNFTMKTFDPDVFSVVLSERPSVISFALGNPGTGIQEAHEAGAKVVVQIHAVEQAREAVSLGADAIIAQGTEAGGFTGTIGLMALLPQVVDAVRPTPVIAAGGIADGRGVAAALVLGAQGVNVGTRFMASDEASLNPDFRRTLLEGRSEDTLRATIIDKLFRPPDGTYSTAMRTLRTPFLDEWEARERLEPNEIDRLRGTVSEAMQAGRLHEYITPSGQSVGLIDDVLPAAEIVRRLANDAETILSEAKRLSTPAA